MSGATIGASSAASAAAAMSQAIKASGVIIRVLPEDFLSILRRQQEPLVVQSTAGFFSTKYLYLTSYKGLAFFTESPTMLPIPANCEIIQSQKIWIPG